MFASVVGLGEKERVACICAMVNLWVEPDRSVGATPPWPLQNVLRKEKPFDHNVVYITSSRVGVFGQQT